jgi:outer membrane receptor protein involved in Fe transport
MYRKAQESTAQKNVNTNLDLIGRLKSESYAGFGEITRTFDDDRFELTGGLRYFHDAVGQRRRSPFLTSAVTTVSPIPAKATTPRVVATWHPDPKSSVYASYSQGFRSGFPQPSPTVAPAKPDKLTNYEIGAKGTALDGKLSFDAAVYYIKWKDVQQGITIIITPPPPAIPFPLSGTINGSGASGIGVDAAVALRPVRGLTLNAAFGWNDLNSDEDVLTGGLLLFPKGGRFNFSPKYTASGSGEYAFPLSDSLTGRLSASATYVSSQLNRVLLRGAIREGKSDKAFIAKTSFSVEARSGWVATLYADNLTNFRGISMPGYADFSQFYSRIRPRTIGLQLEFKY